MVIMTLPEGQVSRLNAAVLSWMRMAKSFGKAGTALRIRPVTSRARVQYAYHFFFDEDDPLPLDEAASIILDGNEIPLSE